MVSKSALAWSLISDDGVEFSASNFNDKELLQLKGLFQSLDNDMDGKLDVDQVSQAFALLGIQFGKETSCVFKELQSIDFCTFVEGLFVEKQRLNDLSAQLDLLLSFYDTNHTGFITQKDLEQLLCAQASPFCFTKKEFGSFVETLEPRSRDRIGVEWIKSKLLF